MLRKKEDVHDTRIQSYLFQMEIIKKRMDAISKIGNREQTTLFRFTNIEFMALQIRKVIEHIAMSNLVVNSSLYKEYNDKFASNWNARLIFRDLERINPSFYPIPVKIVDNEYDDIKTIDPLTDGFLTKDEAIKVYNRCGSLMHVENPFGKQIDYAYYETQIIVWYKKIMVLLATHLIKLVDDQFMYYITMVGEDHISHGTILQKEIMS